MTRFAIHVVTLFLSGIACSQPESMPQATLRAHEQSFDGVRHAQPQFLAERYCQLCHGMQLSGGPDLVPSCYSCHGQNWLTGDGQVSRAPTSHSIDLAGYRHHPGHDQPEQVCSECHGVDLSGTGSSSPPPCTLCHDQLWP